MSLEINEVKIASYRAGSAEEDELNVRIARIWAKWVEDDPEQVARVLDIPASKLDAKTPPFKARQKGSGTGLVEIGVIFLAGVFHETIKAAGESAGRVLIEKAKELWKRLMNEEIRNDTDSFWGPRIPDDDE